MPEPNEPIDVSSDLLTVRWAEDGAVTVVVRGDKAEAAGFLEALAGGIRDTPAEPPFMVNGGVVQVPPD